ncbi:MAG: hypothetical protein A2073_02675 [Deltaproteobacteria bacterium GWC2_42_11]|nr:MAG: hypothetical protein A2073_02675 [Deltaproteobacteria bacterium GWC2_42_11]
MMIEHYEFGKIIIDGRTFTSDLIILPDRIIDNWWRKEGHNLVLADIEVVMLEWPITLVIGTGADGMMKVSKEIRRMLPLRGIKIIEMKTKEACEAYNEMYRFEKTAAALHLTC